MSVNQKILEYLKYKGVSQRSFTKKCNLSEGVLRSGKGIGSIYLKQIKINYPDLNFNWVLFDEGNMIKKDIYNIEQTNKNLNNGNNQLDTVKENCKQELYVMQKKIITIQEKLIKCKEELEEAKKK